MKGDKAHPMPDYRHYRVPGGTYFFTVNLLERRADLLVRHIEPLREAVRCTRADRPFHIAASVADNVVACHSAEHPCGASALRGLAHDLDEHALLQSNSP
jgi:hypothetical protein